MEPEPLSMRPCFFELAYRFLICVSLSWRRHCIPYQKQSGESRLDLLALNQMLTPLIESFVKDYGQPVQIKTEPGRYIVAECGVLLGTVQANKNNGETAYVGTDLGFNVLARPMLYDSWHDIVPYRRGKPLKTGNLTPHTIVGNICETGDVLAKNRALPQLQHDDILAVLDAGAMICDEFEL